MRCLNKTGRDHSMPKSKYETIYKDLKQKIEEEEYAYQELLPSENQLVQSYNCSRNTIRRAVSRLVMDGYVQTMQGKGVRNIYRPVEQAAYTIIRDLQGADMVIDIHSSNIFLREIPQVRINVQTADKLVPYAKLLDVDFIWVHEAATVLEATLAHSLNSLNTPTLVVEMGVGMRINHGYGNRLVNGILNLMHAMGIWGEAPEDISMPTPTVSIGNQVNFINADASGVFLTEIKNNMIVEKGEKIGEVVSPLTGEVLQYVEAPTRGLLFTLRAYPIVYQGSLLARIHQF